MKFGTGNSNLTSILQNRQPILRYRIMSIAHAFVEIVPCAQFRLVFQNLGLISLHVRRPVVR